MSKWPRGALKTEKQVMALLRRAKRKPIPAFHLDSSDGEYFQNIITKDSSFSDEVGIIYFDSEGNEHRSGVSFLYHRYRGRGGWFMFTNYWHAYAFARQRGLELVNVNGKY